MCISSSPVHKKPHMTLHAPSFPWLDADKDSDLEDYVLKLAEPQLEGAWVPCLEESCSSITNTHFELYICMK